jgi:DNA-binding NarL/FixJ family response regulator
MRLPLYTIFNSYSCASFLINPRNENELEECRKSIENGKVYTSVWLRRQTEGKRKNDLGAVTAESLSSVQNMILALMMGGSSVKETAGELGTSETSIKYQLQTLRKMFSCITNTQLALAYADAF